MINCVLILYFNFDIFAKFTKMYCAIVVLFLIFSRKLVILSNIAHFKRRTTSRALKYFFVNFYIFVINVTLIKNLRQKLCYDVIESKIICDFFFANRFQFFHTFYAIFVVLSYVLFFRATWLKISFVFIWM